MIMRRRSPTRPRSSRSTSTSRSPPQLTDPRKLTEAQAQQLIADGQADLLGHRQHPLGRDRQPRDADGAGLSAGGRRDAVHPAHPQQRHHRCITPVARSGRPREAGGQPATTRKKTDEAAPPLVYWGKYVAHDNNRDGMGRRPEAHAEHPERRSSTGIRRCCTTCTSRCRTSTRPPAPGPTTQRSTRSRSTSGGCWRRHEVSEMTKRGVPGRVDRRLLRRLGAELPVLHRQHAQLHRPVLRDAELRPAEPARTCRSARRRRAASGTGPTRRCRRSSGARATTSTCSSRALLFALQYVAKNKETLPRELLPEEQARGRARQDAGAVRLGHPRRPAPARRGRRRS